MARVDMPSWATLKSLAPDFSSSATYEVGAFVNHDSKIWECTTAVDTAGDWTGTTNWTERTIAQMLGAMDAKVDTINTNVAALLARQVEIVVTCVTQDNVTVTGQTVTLRAGTSADAPVYDTRAYNGQPVTFQVPKDFRYFVEVSSNLSGHFAPTTATGTATTNTTSITLTYSDISHITTYADIKAAVNSITSVAEGNTALCGIEIADTWVSDDGVSVYNDPMICQSVQVVQDPAGNTHRAAIMMRKYATKNSIQFDAAENGPEAYASEATAIGGIYYWGYGKDYAQATTYAVNAFCGYKGGIWKCTTAVTGQEAFDENKWSLLDAKWYSASATYDVGDYAKYAGAVYKCTTQISTAEEFDPAKWTQELSAGSFQTGARTALNLAADATVPYAAWTLILRNDVSSDAVQTGGYNNWIASAWRQYLRSNAGIGLWWSPAHIGDCPPEQLQSTRGYQAGCSAALLEYAKPIRVPVWPWNTSAQYTVETLWLPSVTELFGVANFDEGLPFQKVKDDCYKISGWTFPSDSGTPARAYKQVFTIAAAFTTYRSAVRRNAWEIWHLSGGGTFSTYYVGKGAAQSCMGMPCCAIY